MSSSPPVLELRHLSKSYADVAVLDDVSFTVERAEVVALTGPNGSGKSTLLQCAVGWQTPTAGQVLFEGQPYRESGPETRAAVAAALGSGVDFPGLTVREHLEFTARGHGNADPRAVVDAVLDELELGGVADRFPFVLSQGQRRRMGLAACFVRPHRLLVLDEPEQNLDRRGRAWLADTIRAERRAGVSVLMACHDQELVYQVADSEVEFRLDWNDDDDDDDDGDDGDGDEGDDGDPGDSDEGDPGEGDR